MKGVLLVPVFALVLVGAGCDWDDDDDYSYHTENCRSVDYGGGEEYELCCRLSCHGEYDYDHAHEHCDEEYTCESSTEDDCPPFVIDDNWYPECIY